MPPTITLTELHLMQREKEKKRTVCFDKVLELCHKRIRNIAAYGGMNTFYEVPGMLVGYPLYNLFECCGYVIDNLRKTGFLVQILPPPHIAVIYISWDPNEIKQGSSPNAKPVQRKALPAPSDAATASGLSLAKGQGGLRASSGNANKPKRLKLFG